MKKEQDLRLTFTVTGTFGGRRLRKHEEVLLAQGLKKIEYCPTGFILETAARLGRNLIHTLVFGRRRYKFQTVKQEIKEHRKLAKMVDKNE